MQHQHFIYYYYILLLLHESPNLLYHNIIRTIFEQQPAIIIISTLENKWSKYKRSKNKEEIKSTSSFDWKFLLIFLRALE